MIPLSIKNSRYLDTLYAHFEQAPDLVPINCHAQQYDLPAQYQKTLFYTALPLLESLPLDFVKQLDTGLESSKFVFCVNEIDELMKKQQSKVLAQDSDPKNLELWYNFLQESLQNSSFSYSELIDTEIEINVTFSATLPPPPKGQLTRTDLIHGKLQVGMVIGDVNFLTKENRKYALTSEWFHRGLQIALLKYLIPFSTLRDWASSRDKNIDKLLSKLYSQLLWYTQIQLFSPQQEVQQKIEIGVSNGLVHLEDILHIDLSISCTPWRTDSMKQRLRQITTLLYDKLLKELTPFNAE